mmetsp:Transcript_27613/g.41163  ORF Transcript_27613/g.41163 Transcript_27613/m.41163 type:complete len:229 (-) Transcript_27613:1236-1922(-)
MRSISKVILVVSTSRIRTISFVNISFLVDHFIVITSFVVVHFVIVHSVITHFVITHFIVRKNFIRQKMRMTTMIFVSVNVKSNLLTMFYYSKDVIQIFFTESFNSGTLIIVNQCLFISLISSKDILHILIFLIIVLLGGNRSSSARCTFTLCVIFRHMHIFFFLSGNSGGSSDVDICHDRIFLTSSSNRSGSSRYTFAALVAIHHIRIFFVLFASISTSPLSAFPFLT